jgi:hypothetical protein
VAHPFDHSSVGVFLYPGYASYKTLSQRPASEADLERWLMYWSVLGCIVGVEYIAEWLVSCEFLSELDCLMVLISSQGYLFTTLSRRYSCYTWLCRKPAAPPICTPTICNHSSTITKPKLMPLYLHSKRGFTYSYKIV